MTNFQVSVIGNVVQWFVLRTAVSVGQLRCSCHQAPQPTADSGDTNATFNYCVYVLAFNVQNK